VTIRVKLSETGEIAIPQSMRDAHRWDAGTEIEISDEGGRVVLRPVYVRSAKAPSKEQIEAFLAARIKVDRPFPTDEEIDQALLDEAERRFLATCD
jgi:AbrB family looped-hinge helix DNA binding protein